VPTEPVRIPSLAELEALRADGQTLGYRGIHIYLRYRAILATLAHAGVRPARVLVVGCGYGVFDRLLPAGVELTGIDLAANEVAVAAAWARAHRPTWRYRAEPLAACAFPDGAFDLVVLSEVIEHVPEAELPALLAEVVRVIAPHGHLLLTVPNRLHLRNRARRLAGRPLVLMDPTHLREYTLAEARAVVAALPLRPRAFRPAVLYFPREPEVARVIPAHSRLRRGIIRLAPQVASHFVFLLEKP
jgi:2-polyprenyl-3-methyl-5-hydroxy-6-metoxy-1,4-benzoquinol methylase